MMTRILWIAGILAALVVVMTCISGCIGQNVKYLVDYGGAKGCYKYARNSYRAGENVVLIFDKRATDMSYRFYLNGETPDVKFTDKGRGGFQISFVMPAYDVKLECSSYNTMADDSDDPVSEEKTTETIMLDYQQWNAQGGYERLVYISGSDSSKTYSRLDVYRRETADGEEFKTCYKADYMNYLACHEVIKEHGLYSWDIRRDTSVDEGLPIVFRYSASNGKSISVSTERIPADGREALEKIRSLLETYICEENRI